MILTDVNILIYAFRKESAQHERFNAWLEDIVKGTSAFGVSSIVLSGFVRIVTHPRIFQNPDGIDSALNFVNAIRSRRNCIPIGSWLSQSPT